MDMVVPVFPKVDLNNSCLMFFVFSIQTKSILLANTVYIKDATNFSKIRKNFYSNDGERNVSSTPSSYKSVKQFQGMYLHKKKKKLYLLEQLLKY